MKELETETCTEQVVSDAVIMKELRERGEYTADIDDDLVCLVGNDILWVGECSGCNFEALPDPVQKLLQETTKGRIGIYLDI